MRHIRDLSPLEIARFWSKVRVGNRTTCWPWLARTSKKGYGEFGIDGKSIRAPRIVWKLFHGDPGEARVLHTCDNPPCCNPFHLFLSTEQHNTIDSIVKRRRRGLSPEQRTTLRERLRRGDPVGVLAREFGVTDAAVVYHASRLHLPDLDFDPSS